MGPSLYLPHTTWKIQEASQTFIHVYILPSSPPQGKPGKLLILFLSQGQVHISSMAYVQRHHAPQIPHK